MQADEKGKKRLTSFLTGTVQETKENHHMTEEARHQLITIEKFTGGKEPGIAAIFKLNQYSQNLAYIIPFNLIVGQNCQKEPERCIKAVFCPQSYKFYNG